MIDHEPRSGDGVWAVGHNEEKILLRVSSYEGIDRIRLDADEVWVLIGALIQELTQQRSERETRVKSLLKAATEGWGVDKEESEKLKDVKWYSGWYATRLHAVPLDQLPKEGAFEQVPGLCGAYVYHMPPTKGAQQKFRSGKIPRCKHCERILKERQ